MVLIDFAKIRQNPSAQTLLSELALNALQLFLIFYGLKCILFQQGEMLLANGNRRLHFGPMSGSLAVSVGLQYAAFGLFIFMSDGRPPPENRRWFWRVGRSLLRWGSLVLAIWCFFEMPGQDASFLFQYNILWLIVFIAGFFGVQFFLYAMYAREQVKRELNRMCCKPLHILWRPCPYWLNYFWLIHSCGFRVIYSDAAGYIHKGYCLVYRAILLTDKPWGERRVIWLTDTVTGQLPSGELSILPGQMPGEGTMARD